MKALIVSDSRPGHTNQSLALANILGCEYDVCYVGYSNKFLKLLSYLFDLFGIYVDFLFRGVPLNDDYDVVIAAGSTSLYPLKVFARRYRARSVSMMLPRGYRYNIDVIFAQRHDNPPKGPNIIAVPLNFCVSEPQGFYRKSAKPAVGIVLGGNNAAFRFSASTLANQLDTIFKSFPGYEFAVTTSPRTGKDIEELLHHYAFDYKLIYSKSPLNPIPDFLDQCERVFITQDSTSMISEAVSYGKAFIEVLPLEGDQQSKFGRLITALEQDGYVHLFDGSFGTANRKIDFSEYLKKSALS